MAAQASLQHGLATPYNPISWNNKVCTRSARSSSNAETRVKIHEEMENVRALWNIDDQVPHTAEALWVNAIWKHRRHNIRCESGPSSSTDKKSAVGGLALEESFESTKTLLEWLHFDANVSDALTMFDQRAMDLIRAFLNSFTWSIVFNPTITSAKEVRAQTTQLKNDNRNRNGVKTSGSVVKIPLAQNHGTAICANSDGSDLHKWRRVVEWH